MFDASTCGSSADCTRCGCRSSVVHSRYRRTIVDLAVAGREVVIRLMVRRFRCAVAHCERRIFSEQVSGLATRYQRRSPLVAELLTQVGLALGGRPGARMARQLAVPYTDGASRGAPQAIQVADRWHLRHNLTAAVDKVVRAHRECLREDDEHAAVAQPAPAPAGQTPAADDSSVPAFAPGREPWARAFFTHTRNAS